MKAWIVVVGLMLGASGVIQAINFTQLEKPQKGVVHFAELKQWYKEKKGLVILDARTRDRFDNTLLPRAKWLPYTSTEKEIQAVIPSKETTVVVYCWNIHCPESTCMVNNLIAAGYKNVYKYPEGLEDWSLNGMPVFQKKLK